MTPKQTHPPRNVPPRRAVWTFDSPPPVPTRRVDSREEPLVASPPGRFGLKPSVWEDTPQCDERQETNTRHDRGPIAPRCLTGNQALFDDEHLSPQPKDPLNGDLTGALKTSLSSATGPDLGKKSLLYGRSCPSMCDDDDDKSPVRLVGYTICNPLMVEAVVHATPSPWHPSGDFLTPVELHVHDLDVITYPIRRLLRLIHRKLPYRQHNSGVNTLLKCEPLKGHLYIDKEDNKHLPFRPGLPSSIFLNGLTLLTDVLDADQLPQHGRVAHLRWVEDDSHYKKRTVTLGAARILDETRNGNAVNLRRFSSVGSFRNRTYLSNPDNRGKLGSVKTYSDRTLLPLAKEICVNNCRFGVSTGAEKEGLRLLYVSTSDS